VSSFPGCPAVGKPQKGPGLERPGVRLAAPVGSNGQVFLNFLGEETPLNPREFASRKGVYFIFSDAPPLPEGTYLTHVKRLHLGNHKICKPARSEVVSNPAP
jgi:hypothetical protein